MSMLTTGIFGIAVITSILEYKYFSKEENKIDNMGEK